MPKFMDRHPTTPMSDDEIAAMKDAMGKSHGGVTALQFVVGKDQSYCLTEADSAEAVRQYHASVGVELDEGSVEEVTAVLP